MRKATDFFNDINRTLDMPVSVNSGYYVSNHPASKLDDYMKEQYFIILLYAVAQSDSEEKQALSFILYLAKQCSFFIVPESIVKYVYSYDERKKQDCFVSFRDEEIKHLLCFELYLTGTFFTEKNACEKFQDEMIFGLEMGRNEKEVYAQINEVLETQDLTRYHIKEYCSFIRMLKCYLYKFDFSEQRSLLVSNCLEKVRSSDCDRSIFFVSMVPFLEGHFKSDYKCGEFVYVEKGTELGNFIASVGGFSLGMVSEEGWNTIEENEKRLITPKFKNYNRAKGLFGNRWDYDCTYEVCAIKAEKSGVFFFIYNGIGEYNDPFSVISHPLDNADDVTNYLNEQIELSREKNKKE